MNNAVSKQTTEFVKRKYIANTLHSSYRRRRRLKWHRLIDGLFRERPRLLLVELKELGWFFPPLAFSFTVSLSVFRKINEIFL